MGMQIVTREATSSLAQSKQRLSSMWGCSTPDFDCVVYELFNCYDPPSPCASIQGFYETPDFAKAKQAIATSAKNLKLQKANRIPNVTLTAGYSVFTDSGQGGWLIGVEMPLPFFDRNQGNIERARVEICQSEYLLEGVICEFKERIMVIHEKLNASFEESEILKTGVLAEAIDTFELIQTGYQNGKLDYLDLLDAENTLFEIQEHYLKILHDYHHNLAELQRLTGEQL